MSTNTEYPCPIGIGAVRPVIDRVGKDEENPEEILELVEEIHQLTIPQATEAIEYVLSDETTNAQNQEIHISETWICVVCDHPDTPALHVQNMIEEHDLSDSAHLVDRIWNEFAQSKLDFDILGSNAILLPKTSKVEDRLAQSRNTE